MATKFYAVRAGHKTGIYLSWPACKDQIHGFSGAEYKSFKTREEAEAYMAVLDQETKSFGDREVLEAYVDGSYEHSLLKYGGGAVLLHQGQVLATLSEAGDDPALVGMRNVAGELLGAMAAMAWFYEHMEALSLRELVLYHDYEGIAKWATGAWKANKVGTQAYVKAYMAYRERFSIRFVKVLAHSGDTYNEMADQLAKKALGL